MYRFFVKVTASGGSVSFLGPYDLYVGCLPNSANFADSSNFISIVPYFAGGDGKFVYTFYPPVPSLSYCTVVKNEIVGTDGLAWVGPSKILPASNCTSSGPCFWFDISNPSQPDFIQFRVLTTILGNMTHLSPIAAISVASIYLGTVQQFKQKSASSVFPNMTMIEKETSYMTNVEKVEVTQYQIAGTD